MLAILSKEIASNNLLSTNINITEEVNTVVDVELSMQTVVPEFDNPYNKVWDIKDLEKKI